MENNLCVIRNAVEKNGETKGPWALNMTKTMSKRMNIYF